MDAINNLPRPLIIGVVVVLVLLAGFVVFRSVSGDASGGYGSKEEIMQRQKAGNHDNGGHTVTTVGRHP